MKGGLKIWLPITAIAAVGLVYMNKQISAMKEAASLLEKRIGNFQIHTISLKQKLITLKADLVFTNPTATPLPLSSLVIRLYHRNGNQNIPLGVTSPTQRFEIAPYKETIVPIKFTATMSSELLNVVSSVLANAPTEFLIEVIPTIKGKALSPIEELVSIKASDIAAGIARGALNGLGLTTGKKRIKSGVEYEKYFDPSHLKEGSKVLTYGDNFDTLNEMEKLVNRTLHQTKAIAQALKQPTQEATVKKVFDFVNDHFQYQEDQKGREQLRTPARAWADRAKGVDCDCFTIFISSILKNLNIPVAFRMAGYKGGSDYQHVYPIAEIKKSLTV